MFWVQNLRRGSEATKSMLQVGFSHLRRRLCAGPTSRSIRLSATAASASSYNRSAGGWRVVRAAHPAGVCTSCRVQATLDAMSLTRLTTAALGTDPGDVCVEYLANCLTQLNGERK